MKFSTLSTLGFINVLHASLTAGLQAPRARSDGQQTRNLVGSIDILPKSGQTRDFMGNTHERKQQTFNGIPVLENQYIIHHNQDGTEMITGHLREDFQVNTHPKISEQTAVEMAQIELGIVGELNVRSIQLAIVHHKGKDHLVYKIQFDRIDSQDPSMPQVLIDAQTGEVISHQNNMRAFEAHHSHPHPDTTTHSTSSDRKPVTNNNLPSEPLTDEEKTTYDWQTYEVGDASDNILANLHSYAQDTIDFMSIVMGLSFLDDFGKKVESFGHYGDNTVNAFYDGYAFYYGDGDNYYSTTLAILDVVAHEMGHAVTHYFSNLEYYGESGALSEGFSDIIAAAVEAWVDGNKTSFSVSADTWYLGEDAWLQGTALRYMMSPSVDGFSTDHYSEIYTGPDDNGGVHWNSGIFNHFFYLLTVGGQHHNEKFHTANYVDGIGMGEAYMIVSMATMFYLTSYSNFADAREATINACEASFFNETTCETVKKAWAEVGVGCVLDDQCKLGSPCAIATCLEDGSCLYEGRDESCNPCEDNEVHIGIDLVTDQYGEETSWNIADVFFQQVIQAGGSYKSHTNYALDYCLPKTACYEFTIYDTFGDGILSPGGYTVWADGVQIKSGGGDDFPFGSETVEIPCDTVTETFDVELDFWFDYYPQETGWYVTTEYFGNTVQVATSGAGFVKENARMHSSQNVTLPARACYDFYIFDDHGDGMCCDYGEGNFTVKVEGDVVLSGSDFGYSQHVRIGACDEICPDGEKAFKLHIGTDNFGSETHWSVANSDGEVVLRTEGTYASRTENVVGFCLPEDDCYNFTITDDHGDGLCCYSGSGGYSVEWDGSVVATGGDFGFYDSVMFGGNCSAPLNMRREMSEQKMEDGSKDRKILDSKEEDRLLRGRNKLEDKDESGRSISVPTDTVRVIDFRRQKNKV